MPRIDDGFLDCVVYLYPSEASAKAGAKRGGSGFLVGVPSALPERVHLYAVTNRHVLYAHKTLRLNSQDGSTDIIDTDKSNWRFDENEDIAVMPIALSGAHKYRYVPLGMFVSRATIAQKNIGPGDEVFIVGRFVNHEGRQSNTPCVRFGNLSMMPNEPVKHKTNASGVQESFLADLHAVSGYSGSPTFVCAKVIETSGNLLNFTPHASPSLLGVEWGVLNLDDGEESNSGMTCIVPAWKLHDLLNAPEMIGARVVADRLTEEELRKIGTSLT